MSLSTTALAHYFHSICKSNPTLIKALIEASNSSMFLIGNLIYCSFPSNPPSMSQLCDFTLGKSTIENKRPSIAAIPHYPSHLQMSITRDTSHFLPIELRKLLSITIVFRHTLVKLLKEEMENEDLHCLSHFLFTQIGKRGDSYIAQRIESGMMKDILPKQLNHHFHRVQDVEKFNLTELKELKKSFHQDICKNTTSLRSMATLDYGATAFGHAGTTQFFSYSNPIRSEFGTNLNSTFDPVAYENDVSSYQFYGLGRGETDELNQDNNKSEYLPVPLFKTVEFWSIRQSDDDKVMEKVKLLYNIFLDLEYTAEIDCLGTVNEILCGARSSIHIYGCGYGKTSFVALPAMARLMDWISSQNDHNQAIDILLRRKGESELTEDQIQRIKQAAKMLIDIGWKPKSERRRGVTLVVIPITSLKEDHIRELTSKHLLCADELTLSTFKLAFTRYCEDKSADLLYKTNTDMYITTYSFVSANLGLVEDAIKCGYIEEVIFDEVHSFVHQFLSFHENLKSLQLRHTGVPIYSFSGTISPKEETLLKQMLFDQTLHRLKSEAVQFKCNNASDHACFQNSCGIYRAENIVPTNLQHGRVHFPTEISDADSKYFLICETLFLVNKFHEFKDVIIFMNSKGDVEKMYKAFSLRFQDQSFISHTGKRNDESQQEHRARSKNFIETWITNDSCKYAICTTSGSIGINNRHCNLALHIDTYFGVQNYLQSASRANRCMNETGTSIFFASSFHQYERNNEYYARSDHLKLLQLKSCGIKEPNMNHASNDDLKRMFGPSPESPCIQCSLENYFNGPSSQGGCMHEDVNDGREDGVKRFTYCFSLVKFFFICRSMYFQGHARSPYNCTHCPVPDCDGCSEPLFPSADETLKWRKKILLALASLKKHKGNITKADLLEFSQDYRNHPEFLERAESAYSDSAVQV